MNFLIDFLRPTNPDGSSPWYHLLKKAGGGCNDLIYSGHMLVSVLTAMAWTVCVQKLFFLYLFFYLLFYPSFGNC